MLQISNLCKTYPGGVRALDGLSLEIPRGLFGLLGPNGAGKSTLMRTLATLQEPDSGSIVFEGLDVLREKDSVRRLLGYLPQDFGLYPKVSAEALLDHFAVLKGISQRRERRALVRGLLERTNLWEVRGRPLGGFSGGMRQRFGIAQALLGEPRLLIVDEPTAGLDPEERGRFLNLLAEIGESVAVLLSTHLVDDVAELCGQMAIIAGGRVRLACQPAQAIAALQGRIWRKALAKGELERFAREHELLSTRLVAGRAVAHVYAQSDPGEGFEPIAPECSHVYFHALHGAAAAGAAQA